ncbi:MAG: NADPH:quinone reductase [Capsulimonadales bacterium]|nr:NADPH:quinone reductase [Capsulimonadales bacterium]
MKAVRVHEFGGPEVLRLEEMADPTPGPGYVVIDVRAVGVNPVDAYIRSGNYGRNRPLPYTPGSDAAGVVSAVGEGVTNVAVGDRVYTAGTLTGAYAEKTCAEAASVYRFPDQLTFAQAAGINVPYATAYRALIQRAHAVAGETVLVHGASGGVGIASLQIARALGLTVVGTAGTAEGRELVLREGAHAAFDHRADGYLEAAVKETTGGKGFDVILEMLANINLAKDLTALAPFGRVVVIGNRGTIEINPRETMSRDAAILGMSLFNVPTTELRSIHAALFAGFENGTLRPVVGRELPLSAAAQAHVDILSTTGAHGKIVLIPGA